jgi:signal transduction histidine kinase
MVDEYEAICRHKLSSGIKKSDEASERVLQDIRNLAFSTSTENGAELLPELRGILARLDPATLARVVEDVRTMLPSLAAELGMLPPAVLTQQADARLTSDWLKLVKDLLVQCFRNSLYHGLEGAEERQRAGKPARGNIAVRARHTPGGLELAISDDGRGLWLEKLRERPGNRDLSDEALAEQLFIAGVSTAESISQFAGRGVGLDIVRATLRSRGGDALVRFTGEARGGYRPFTLVLVLPKSAVASRPSERPSSRPQPPQSTAPARA